MKLKITILTCLFGFIGHMWAQVPADRIEQIQKELYEASERIAGLNEKVNITSNDWSASEVIRGIGISHGVNVTVEDGIENEVSYSFRDAMVKDVFVHLCKEYSLEITWTGDIIAFKRYIKPDDPIEVKVYQGPDVKFAGDKMTVKLKKDTLQAIAEKIVELSDYNILVDPSLQSQIINTRFDNVNIADGLNHLVMGEYIKVVKSGDKEFKIIPDIERKEAEELAKKEAQANHSSQSKKNKKGNKKREPSGELDLAVSATGDVTLTADEVDLGEVVRVLFDESKRKYFLFSEMKGTITANVINVDHDETLNYLLTNTDYTYTIEDDVYLIGERKGEGLRQLEIFTLQYRTVEKIKDAIPQEIAKNVSISISEELNAVVLSGSAPEIADIKKYLRQIDKVIPVVTIEVMIIENIKNKTQNTGLAGGREPGKTNGLKFDNQGVNVDLNGNAINNLLSYFNDFGYIKLGRVSKNFYLQLSAMEGEGMIKRHSTPKLSTLNGHEASLKIGETDYYLEQTQNVHNGLNTQTTMSFQYKQIQADFAIDIKPQVTGDEYVTLEISVSESTFQPRSASNAPRGKLTKEFKSTIRVKNEEVILLGGLQKKTIQNDGSGAPFLSSIPVIKWFFSSRSKEKKNSKLNILIKPTIIY